VQVNAVVVVQGTVIRDCVVAGKIIQEDAAVVVRAGSVARDGVIAGRK
jgi:hypothetical protein